MAVPGRACVAYVHPNEVSASFHACLNGMIMWDASHHQRLIHDTGQLAIRCGTDGLVQAREQGVDLFLKSDTEWLLWVDSDMGWAPDSLDGLLAVADPKDRPVVGGLCFAAKETGGDGMGGHRSVPKPTIYIAEDGKYRTADWYPVNRLVRCDATGSAFVVIHRTVLERVGRKFGCWYQRTLTDDGRLLGEDISFCDRLRQLDIPLYVHTGIRTTHHKDWWVAEDDFWRTYLPPPATERCAVIVPVLQRPQNAAPFMRSLRASTGLAAVYAVADPDDTVTQQAWLDEGANVLISTRGTRFAQKANHGYQATTEPWLLLVGDDVRFHPGWLDHALHTAEWDQADLVATNDLGNARVTAGRHATHPLIRRSYVDTRGASWDGPGVIACEEYAHNFVDDEWTAVAQQRGVFAAALGARVEHLHPFWGKAVDDLVYQKGKRQFDRDRRIFERRLREHAQAAA